LGDLRKDGTGQPMSGWQPNPAACRIIATADCSDSAEQFGARLWLQQSHKIIQNRLALVGEESVRRDRGRAAVARTPNVPAFARKRAARQPFPEHLPRERVVEPGRPHACAAAARGCASRARTSPRRWRSSRGNGRRSRTSAKSLPAATARRSARRRRRSMCWPGAGPVPAYWR